MRSSWLKVIVPSLLATAALLAAGAAPALAANEIAYRCGLDICLLDPASPSAVTNLTDNGAASLDEAPVWSPDGKKVAFVARFASEPTQTRNVYVMEPEAPGQSINLATQVTHFSDGGFLGEPVWSPDGTKIAFVRGADEGSRSIQVAASNGTTATPVVVAEHGQHPSWAPDSGKIAYSFGNQVFLKNSDGSGAATPLANGAGKEPIWSPDGSKIGFDLPQGFSTVNLQIANASGTGTPVTLTSGAQFTFSAWSPSGAQIVYEVSGGGEDHHWRVANADGSGDHALPEIQELNPNGPAPSWSPSGTRIVYQGFYFGGGANTTEVYVENTDGTGSVTALTGDDSHEPSWRPIPSAAPQMFTPAGGSTAPLPATQKPKTVWITKRIPFTPGPDQSSIFIGSYGCGGPSCGVVTQGTAKYVGPPSILLRPTLATASGKPKYKPRTVVVGHGKTTIPGGKSGPIRLNLTKPGIKLLEHQGALTIAVTVTVTIPRQKKIVEHRQVRVFVKKAKAKKKHAG